MTKMLEFKRVFNLCKKFFIYEYIEQEEEFRNLIERYLDEYFKKKIKECN